MGLLDEAIRQHLELKRSRGADPHEVARQEDEALGAIGVHEPASIEADVEPAQAPPDAPDPDEPDEAPEASALEEEPTPDEAVDEAPIDLNQPTVEFVVEDEPGSRSVQEPGSEDEDVLEDTPEFLQETPEHDRLWFEQKPPRDFDF